MTGVQTCALPICTASIKADSQAAVLSLRSHRAGPGSYLLDKIHELSVSLKDQSLSDLRLRVSWVSGHNGVAGNERADLEAKDAAAGSLSTDQELPLLLRSAPLPCSITATKQHFRTSLMLDWKIRWSESPRFQHTAKIDSRLPDTSFLRLTKEISKSQASVLFQLRSEHIPLCKYLFRIGKTDSPVCALCQCGDETVHHFFFNCPAHHHARFDLGRALGRHSKSLHYLLGNKKALKLLICFVNDTGRFHSAADSP